MAWASARPGQGGATPGSASRRRHGADGRSPPWCRPHMDCRAITTAARPGPHAAWF